MYRDSDLPSLTLGLLTHQSACAAYATFSARAEKCPGPDRQPRRAARAPTKLRAPAARTSRIAGRIDRVLRPVPREPKSVRSARRLSGESGMLLSSVTSPRWLRPRSLKRLWNQLSIPQPLICLLLQTWLRREPRREC